MCGLTGIFSRTFLSADEKALFKTLLIANYLRGVDSTGVISVTASGNIAFDKRVIPSPAYVFTEQYKTLTTNGTKGSINTLMGHTRHGTIGGNIVENAHPFVTDNFVGMHNGTISDDFEGSRGYGTDSEALYNLISKKGIIPTIKYIEEECYIPAYALQMVSREKFPHLHFVKNDARELWFTLVSNGTTLVWSSSLQTLKWACYSHGLKTSRHPGLADMMDNLDFDTVYKPETSPFFKLKPGVLMSVDTLKNVKDGITFEVFEIPEYRWSKRVVPFRGQKVVSSQKKKQNGGTSSQALLTGIHDQKIKETILKAMKKGTTDSGDDTPVRITTRRFTNNHKRNKGVFQNYRGFNNRVMNKRQILTALKKGCSICQKEVFEDDYEQISQLEWVGKSNFVCLDCQERYTCEEIKIFAEA